MATTTYKTTRTTNVEVSRRAAPRREAQRQTHSPAFSVAVLETGELRIAGVRPDILAERLASVVRLLTR